MHCISSQKVEDVLVLHVVNGSDLFSVITAEIDDSTAQTLRQLHVIDKRVPKAETFTPQSSDSARDSIDMSKVYNSKD